MRLVALLAIAGVVATACGSDATFSDPEPEPGGCKQSNDCAANERCDFADDRCGAGELGSCVAKPNGCSTGAGPYPYVCGCDGAFHSSECLDADGVDGSPDASLCHDPPPGTFACGSIRCNAGYDYCLVADNDSSCHPAPPGCTSCDCVAQPTCTCSEDGDALTVSCPN